MKPNHIAIVMDGNRRWAKQYGMPSALGHVYGARNVRKMVKACIDRGIDALTLFAFSTENWSRPAEEVASLMKLLSLYLRKEVKDMNTKGVRFKLIGDISAFDTSIQSLIHDAEKNTAHNNTITLTIAANYGGRWDITQAVKQWQKANPSQSIESLDENGLATYLSTAGMPSPDLLIRTGGDQRISNFLLWQISYSELYFTPVLWPAFTERTLDLAIESFKTRERRFGGNPVPVLYSGAL